ncbi:amino acid aminotransferase [Phenylobacterium koreense]|uniref:Aromatic-amino-acid transaminase n=1 Tax=Phenylobacterium koreense TaxID=266125 RepID=A0ABV2EMU3_9CAUL
MSDVIAPARSLFAGLKPQAPDPLLSLIALYKNDPRPQKIDLGVGVYRNDAGDTPVFAAIKGAERVLLETQPTKAYLGPEGDLGFLELMTPVVFGEGKGDGLIALQTPGGTGALRLAAELVNASTPGARIWMGTPSWPIHAPIFRTAGLAVETFGYFDVATQRVCFDEMMAALSAVGADDVVLLHGACHNPTGADLSIQQWREVAALLAARGAVPLVDLAYQGLGDGLDADAAGLRTVMDACDRVLVAYSCDKNFGLYRERTGALFVRARGEEEIVRSNILQLARCAWSMPPDHGAAAVRVILEDAALSAQWRTELDTMRERINQVRHALADADPRLEPLRDQRGLFSLLPLAPSQVEAMRRDHAIYMAGSGRINLAGLTTATVEPFVQALAACLQGDA